jgi:hypothetical protein
MRRFLAGLLLTPFVAAAVAVVGVLTASSVPTLNRYFPPMVVPDDLPFLTAWALLFAVGVTALGVIPLALWQRSRPPAHIRAHLIAGTVLGMTPFLLLGIVATSFAALDADLQRIGGNIALLVPFALIGAVAGAAAALVFFFAVAPTTPDRDGAA